MRPNAARGETLGVFAAITGIVALGALRIALLGGSEGPVHLQPYQRLDSTLTPAQRTLDQSLLAATDEIVDRWRSSGAWPQVARLEQEQIPPFAAALLPPRLRGCVWSLTDRQSWADYLGRCPDPSAPTAYLLRIVDLRSNVHPHPHPSYDPAQQVASQVWLFFGSDVPYPVDSLLEADWLWYVNVADPSLKGRR